MRVFLSLASLFLLAGCELMTGPALPTGAVRFDPPAIYAEWWRMAEQCSALGGDLSRVAFYSVPDKILTRDDGDEVQGVYLYGDRIVLTQRSMYAGHVVRHEMLHALLKGKGHPRADFVGRCGGVVTCSVKCIEEGKAPTKPLNAVTVSPSTMEISVDVWPESPGPDVLDGYVRVTVSARNPRSQPVLVNLPTYYPGTPLGFSARLAVGAWMMVREQPVYALETGWFGPGETKRFVFEFWASQAAPFQVRLTPGAYSFAGAFGGRWGTAVPRMIR
ncbi:MAG TPA: hypothetical protein VEB19_10180 [Gemmatimonadaceae bacterium]|nr:hypothetical protein [Gemmatimonadaceae bacterium]